MKCKCRRHIIFNIYFDQIGGKHIPFLKLFIIKRKRNRRIWVKERISTRHVYEASNSLLKKMRQEDLAGYKNHVRVPPEKFDEVLSKINNNI